MSDRVFKLSDEAIVYLRDILTLGIVTRTDIVGHLRQMKLQPELRGEIEYLTPTESYKAEYAIVAEQLLKALEEISNADQEASDNAN